MQDSAVFGVTQQKYIALKYMKMPPRRYVYADLIMRYVPFFLYFLPVLLVAFLLVDGSVWQALGSFVMLFSFRFLGEAVQVWYYEKKETVLSRKVGLVWLLIGISLCGSLSADSAAGRAAHDVDSLQHPRRDRHASHRRGEFLLCYLGLSGL